MSNVSSNFHIKDLFVHPKSLELAKRELAQAQREIMEAHSQAEYYTSIAEYNQKRINRLAIQIFNETKNQEE